MSRAALRSAGSSVVASSSSASQARKSPSGTASVTQVAAAVPRCRAAEKAAAPLVFRCSGAGVGGSSSSIGLGMRPGSPDTAGDEALAMALAFGEEELPGRISAGQRQRPSSSVGFSVEGDEALARLLAREEEEAEAAELAAVLAVVEGNSRFHLRDLHAHSESSFVDVDRMGYEELLELGDRIGYATCRRPTTAQLQRLPTRTISEVEIGDRGQHPDADQAECAVCCDAYAPGDELRTLQCLHSFHVGCIDQWLKSNRPGAFSCPICHAAVEL